jgi:hypothetical protein
MLRPSLVENIAETQATIDIAMFRIDTAVARAKPKRIEQGFIYNPELGICFIDKSGVSHILQSPFTEGSHQRSTGNFFSGLADK